MKLGLTPEQVADRRNGIGGSDAGAIMKGEWRKLWLIKTGRAEEEDLSGNLAVQMGSATEDLNAFWFEKVTGRKVRYRGTSIPPATWFGDYSQRGHPIGDGNRPWMRANLDGIAMTRRGHFAYWDAKHIGGRVDDAVLRYTPQMTHCAHLCRLDWWVLSIFIGNGKHEIVEQQVDPLYLEELLAKEKEFWGYVERDEEPPEGDAVAPPAPTPALRRIYLEDSSRGKWPNWGQPMIRLFDEFVGTHAAAVKHAIVRDDIKALLPEDVGFVRYGLVDVKKSKAGAVSITLREPKDGPMTPGEMG
jgi:hypothetical protein